MTKQEYKLYLGSEEWQAKRKAFLKIYNYCNRCDLPRWVAILAYDNDLNIHHRNYCNLGNERLEDLEALCKRCHEIDNFGRTALKSIRFEKCPGCGNFNYDPYADLCLRCVAVSDYLRATRPVVVAFENGNDKGKAGRS